jgi:hypothetical protein
MKNIITIFVCSLALILCSASAFAQADTLKVDYFANANTAGAPDGTVRLDNPGTNPSATGNICADIFVFDPNQEMSECCSCLLTPDGLRTLSVNTDITGNPLTGVTLTNGVIKVVSSRPSKTGSCPFPTYLNPAPGVRSWVTHIQNSNFAVTETGSQDATLSSTEIASLAKQCSDIKIVGSGKGVCTCGTGD